MVKMANTNGSSDQKWKQAGNDSSCNGGMNGMGSLNQ
jgi:hypothetical protein